MLQLCTQGLDEGFSLFLSFEVLNMLFIKDIYVIPQTYHFLFFHFSYVRNDLKNHLTFSYIFFLLSFFLPTFLSTMWIE